MWAIVHGLRLEFETLRLTWMEEWKQAQRTLFWACRRKNQLNEEKTWDSQKGEPIKDSPFWHAKIMYLGCSEGCALRNLGINFSLD